MSESADCIVSDLVRTVQYYQDKAELTPEMRDLLNIAEHMVTTISSMRQTQIMRATMRNLHEARE